MITINGTAIDSNIYLGNRESTPKVSSTQKRSIGGVSNVVAQGLHGGENLVLGTVRGSGGKIRGFWKQSDTELIKTLEELAAPITVIYWGTTYTFLITGRSFEQFNVSEPCHADKLFLGDVFLTEV